MRFRAWLRVGLVLLALHEGVPAAWAGLLPESFYAGFPGGGHAWVAAFPPYNEHLVRDFGMAMLQVVAVLLFAAAFLEHRLVQAALIGSLLFNVPHLVFHQDHLVPSENVAAQLASLIAPIVVALVLLWLNHRIRTCALHAPSPVFFGGGERKRSPD